MSWIGLFIRRPIFLLMIETFTMVLGVIGFQRLGVDQYPEIEPPIITVTTEYPGAGPHEVESLVTKLLEEEINQIGGIERLVSTSSEGISQVVVEFELSMDAKEAQADVRDKVSRVRSSLPNDIEEPLIQRLDFADRPILQIALGETRQDTSGSPTRPVSEAQLWMMADQQIKPRLQKISGVGQVNIFGGRQREVHVYLDQQRLVLWKLTPSDVSQAIRRSNLNVPAGEVREEPSSRSIRLLSEFQSINEINDTIVRVLPGGRPITIKDLGTVKDTFKERDSFARVNGQSVVLIEIKKESDSNTVQVAEELKAQLPSINRQLSGKLELSVVFDGARAIKMSVNDVIETMVVAALLAVLVVYLFLGSLQATFITGISLPTTIITTFFAMYMFGFTLNVMTLLGLTLAVGLLLDDAIVVRENIWNKMEQGISPHEAAFTGTKEVYIAVLASSLTVLATFIPITFIPGIVGKFFSAFAMTICICVVISTFDALTVAPTLSALMVSRKKSGASGPKESSWRVASGKWIIGIYSSLLEGSLRRPSLVLVGSVALFVASLFMTKHVGFTFLPADDSGEIEISFEAEPGTTIQRTNKIVQQIEDVLQTHADITLVSARVGNDLGEKNVASLYLKLVDESQRSMSTEDWRSKLRQQLTPLFVSERLTASIGRPGGGGQGKPIQAIVEGSDVEQLFAISQQFIHAATMDLPEVTNVESNLKPGRSEIQMRINRTRVAAFALNPERVGNTLRGLFEGEIAGPYREEGEEYDIRVQLLPEQRLNVEALHDFTIPNDRNEAVPLSAVTEKTRGISPTKMIRIDQQRAVRIQADLAEGIPLAGALEKVASVIEPTLPENYRLTFQGQAESLDDLRIGAITALLLGALFIYMIMASLYESLIIPFSILTTLPLAIIGAIGGLLATGKFLDVYSVIGIILLMGLVTKNAILLVDYAEQLRADGLDRHTALMTAGIRRFRPIMMTSIAMIAGMAPVAIGMGELNKVRAGMGVAAIGGLVTSTVLSLVVVPCIYIYLDDLRCFMQRMVARIYGSEVKSV